MFHLRGGSSSRWLATAAGGGGGRLPAAGPRPPAPTTRGGGPPATTVAEGYGFGGLIGPAGGTAQFDASIVFTYTPLVGPPVPLGSLDFSYLNMTPGPFSTGQGDTLALPALGEGTLTLSGFFQF